MKLDIVPDKGWETEDVIIPPGMHITAKVTREGEDEEEEPSAQSAGQTPFYYPSGVGQMIMNGCFGTNYQAGDPCYEAKWKTSACLVSGMSILFSETSGQ